MNDIVNPPPSPAPMDQVQVGSCPHCHAFPVQFIAVAGKKKAKLVFVKTEPAAELFDAAQVRVICGMPGDVGAALFRRMVKSGTFPQPVTLGRHAKRWLRSEIDAWLDARVKARALAQRQQQDPNQGSIE